MPLSWDQPSLVGDGAEVASPAPVDLGELLRLDQPPPGRRATTVTVGFFFIF
jgi:hypothetical protein